ncbi:GNAT family N-acetyltransferase [Nonomuraea sp. NPDC059194]|uniref:GNAT family N-acetyltransferase n=1 Tax=Nonomuraea sp. NPDC059194 TaxID=3346764 RepID=UPI00369A9623
MTDEVTIVDNPDEHRFEIHVGDTLAGFAEYKLLPTTIVITHTEVDPAFEGKGLASRLVRRALDVSRDTGLKVRPLCPYVAEWISRHPDYQAMVEVEVE